MNLIEQWFPQLQVSEYEITSPRDGEYNCIAWAASDHDQWWWPDSDEQYYWPQEVRRVCTLAAFAAAYATIGYRPCESQEPEDGLEKVVVFADSNGIPTHAARQLSNGRWTSKLGNFEDIEHDLLALTGELYGSVAAVLGRRTAGPSLAAGLSST